MSGDTGQPTPAPDVAAADAKLGEAAALEPKPGATEVKLERQPPIRKPLPAQWKAARETAATPSATVPA